MPLIDGLEYHEGLNAVFIRGGVAGNVLPDECVVEVNHRFAPDRSEAEAEQFVRGGVAGNVLPDECVVEVNFRFAPDRSEAEAVAYVRDLFDGFEVTLISSAPAAPPRLDAPAVKAFLHTVGAKVHPKFGWTDVVTFAGLGVPAVNLGPGDPMLAHKQEEHVQVEQIVHCEQTLRNWLVEDRHR